MDKIEELECMGLSTLSLSEIRQSNGGLIQVPKWSLEFAGGVIEGFSEGYHQWDSFVKKYL